MVYMVKQFGYSIRRASEEVGLDRHTLSRWVRNGWVKASFLPNGRYRISEEEMKRLRSELMGLVSGYKS